MTCSASLIIPILAVLSVYDGDTITVSAEPWPRVTVTTSVRIKGVDTPEIRGDCDKERHLAQDARAFVIEWLSEHPNAVIVGPHLGKYAGRIVAYICDDNENLSDALIAESLARPYDGGTRESWCEETNDQP